MTTVFSWGVPIGVGVAMTGWNARMRRRDTLRSQIRDLTGSVDKLERSLTNLSRFVLGSPAHSGFPATDGLLGRLTNVERGLTEIKGMLVKMAAGREL